MSIRSCLLVAAAITFLAGPISAQSPSPPEGWTDGYVIANGIRIHYWRTGGDKPPLIMAHGSSDDGLCWTNLARELTDQFDIILPDARGHGLSDPPSQNESADSQAEDIAGLIRALNLENPILMGHSMGSASVALFASRYPNIPRAVILEDPRLIPRSPEEVAERAAVSTEDRVAEILARNNMTLEQLVAGCMDSNPLWGLAECQIWAPSKQRHHPYTAYARISERPPMSELLPKIICPTLILKADADDATRRQNDTVAALLPDGKIVHIEGAGHNVRREQKERLLAVLVPFLQGL